MAQKYVIRPVCNFDIKQKLKLKWQHFTKSIDYEQCYCAKAFSDMYANAKLNTTAYQMYFTNDKWLQLVISSLLGELLMVSQRHCKVILPLKILFIF